MFACNYSCAVYLETVHPRGILEGRLEIIIPNTISLNHVYVDYIGEASCQWNLKKSTIRFPHYYPKGTEMTNSKIFYYYRHNIYDSEMYSIPNDKMVVFPFSSTIPHGPSTWIGKHGKINYRISLTVQFSNNSSYTHEEDIIVIRKRDLTLEKHLLNEIYHMSVRYYKYGLLGIGSVLVTLWLPLCGYSTGQSIPIIVNVENFSQIKFRGLDVVLTMTEVYKCEKPFFQTLKYRKDTCKVNRIVDIGHGTNVYYVVLEIDKHLPPTNQFSRCTCCHVIYEIWMTLVTSVPRFKRNGYPNLTTPGIPVIVGDVPLSKINIERITANIMDNILRTKSTIVVKPPPVSKEAKDLQEYVDSELSKSTITKLTKQIEQIRITKKKNLKKKKEADGDVSTNESSRDSDSSSTNGSFISVPRKLTLTVNEINKLLVKNNRTS